MADDVTDDAIRPLGERPRRRTPYELVFENEPFESRFFPDIQREAREHEVDPLEPERFFFLSVVGDAIRAVAPSEAPPEALDQYRALLFHAFNFWRFERRVYRMEPALARFLVEAAPTLDEWEPSLPRPSVYLQLPENLFWSSITPETPPEAIDGFFVTGRRFPDARGREVTRLEVLAVLGLRRDRAGFSVIPIEAAAGASIVGPWAEPAPAEGRRDFETVLPGGELSGLYSIVTAAEALKLVARALWYIESYHADVQPAPELGPSRFRVALGAPGRADR